MAFWHLFTQYLLILISGLFFFFPDLSRTYTQDGVCLTESGLCQLQSLSATASRRRKPKPKLKLKIINQNSVAVLQAPLDPHSEHSRDEDMEDNRGTCPPTQSSSFNSRAFIRDLQQSRDLLASSRSPSCVQCFWLCQQYQLHSWND